MVKKRHQGQQSAGKILQKSLNCFVYSLSSELKDLVAGRLEAVGPPDDPEACAHLVLDTIRTRTTPRLRAPLFTALAEYRNQIHHRAELMAPIQSTPKLELTLRPKPMAKSSAQLKRSENAQTGYSSSQPSSSSHDVVNVAKKDLPEYKKTNVTERPGIDDQTQWLRHQGYQIRGTFIEDEAESSLKPRRTQSLPPSSTGCEGSKERQ